MLCKKTVKPGPQEPSDSGELIISFHFCAHWVLLPRAHWSQKHLLRDPLLAPRDSGENKESVLTHIAKTHFFAAALEKQIPTYLHHAGGEKKSTQNETLFALFLASLCYAGGRKRSQEEDAKCIYNKLKEKKKGAIHKGARSSTNEKA